MNRCPCSRARWLLLAALAASCTRTTETLKPPEVRSERDEKLAALIEKIEALERRLAAPRPGEERPAPEVRPARPESHPLTAETRPAASSRSDSEDARTGTNAIVSLAGGPIAGVGAPRPEPAPPVTLKSLIAALETASQADPKNLAIKRQLRVLYLLDGQDEKALQLIDGAQEAEQTFWRQMMWALVNYTDEKHGLGPDERAGLAIHALDEARQALTRQARLEVRKLAFCTDISGFGSYTEPAGREFQPKELVLLYCELDGFATQPTADKTAFRVVVKQELRLLSPRGEVVWSREFEPVEDLCRVPRHDFYFYSKFNLPDHLPAGQYRLKVTMTDALGGKTAEDFLALQVR